MKYYRKDTSDIGETPARELSATLIDDLAELTFYEDEDYYDLEDRMTEIINNYFKAIEKGETK